MSMYRKILVALDTTASDQELLPHIAALATAMKSDLLLLHVADGWVARNFDDLKLRESEEIQADRAYLERLCAELAGAGLKAEARLAMGDPATELIKVAGDEQVDLIAMATHGHRFLGDLVHGTTVDKLRHLVAIPVLLVRAK